MIKLKNALSSALSSSGGQKVGSILFLGGGGPYNAQEGSTSLLIQGKDKVLIDCGPLVYASLQKETDISGISIVLTSCTESSIGSLATLVSHLSQESGQPKIYCADHLVERIEMYLYNVCGLPDGTVLFCGPSGPSMDVSFYETSPETATCVLDFDKYTVVHSGQINSSVFPVIEKANPIKLKKLGDRASDVMVFHDASLTDDDYGCFYERLSDHADKFKNFFVFGHSEEDGQKMMFTHRYMRSMAKKGGVQEFNIEQSFNV